MGAGRGVRSLCRGVILRFLKMVVQDVRVVCKEPISCECGV